MSPVHDLDCVRWDRFEEAVAFYASTKLVMNGESGVSTGDIPLLLAGLTVVAKTPCPYRINLDLSDLLSSRELAAAVLESGGSGMGREEALVQLALRESFLSPSNAVREQYENMIVRKTRLVDYMLAFGVDDFFNHVARYFKSALAGNLPAAETGDSAKVTLATAQNRALARVTQEQNFRQDLVPVNKPQYPSHLNQVALPGRAGQVLAELDWSLAFASGEQPRLWENRYNGTVLRFADNSRYEGKLNKDERREGLGKMTWSDGVMYTGDFKDGMRHGYGTQEDKAGIYTYKGDWADDLPHGFGTITWLDGTSFEGKLARGRLVEGKYTFASGNQYEGQFSEETGKFEGQGLFTSDAELTEGTWRNGRLHGPGVRRYATGDVYHGTWVDD